MATQPTIPRTLPVFSLEGKNCIITGGAGGLGRECLTAFSSSGANCACVDLDLGNCQSAIEEVSARILKETGYEAGKMLPYACNATNEEEVGATVAQIINDFDHIDVLVTCAGICIHCEAETTGLAAWRKVLGVNLDGTFLFAREVGKHMLEKHIKGSMVFVASGAATHPPRPQAQVSYNASKAGVKQMAVSLATEWAGRGIRVNTLSPGYMTTPLMPVTDLQMEWLTQIPMGRFAHPSELRGTLVWMASEASSYMTASDIVVDGGWTAW